MGEFCRAESSSELQPYPSSSKYNDISTELCYFHNYFDAYQLFLMDKQLISLGGQVVRSKRILTVLLDEIRVQDTKCRHATTVIQMPCIEFSPQHLLA
jgi:hypothetical protein